MSFHNTGILGLQIGIWLFFSVYKVIAEKLTDYLLWTIEGNKALCVSTGTPPRLSWVLP